MIELTTKRLKLVPMDLKYLKEIYEAYTPELTRYMYPKPFSKIEEAKEFIDQSIQKNNQSTDMIFVATKKNDGEFIGCMGIHQILTRTPKMGLWIKKAAFGNEYGKEGMDALIRYAMDHLDVHHLIYDVDKDNIASRRIAEMNNGIVQRKYERTGLSGNVLNIWEYWIYKNAEDAVKKPKIILFQGDSITDAGRNKNDFINLGNGYPKMIQDLFPECIVINRGISGHRTVELAERWDRDTLDLKPDFLSILIGINEIWHKYLHNKPMTLERFETIYRQLLSQVKTKLPDTKILLIEPFVLPFGHYDPIWQKDLDAEKVIVRQLAREYADYFIPLDDIFQEQATTLLKEEILMDGVHPTEKGHQIITREIKKILCDFLSQK